MNTFIIFKPIFKLGKKLKRLYVKASYSELRTLNFNDLLQLEQLHIEIGEIGEICDYYERCHCKTFVTQTFL